MASDTFTLDRPLSGNLDIEAQALSIPADFTVKGMFFHRHVKVIGSSWDALAPRLTEPPKGGRYLMFKDYPQADYARVIGEAALRGHPTLGLREGLRRLAREDFGVFSDSMLGKVVLAVVGDARGALLRTPMVYDKVAPGNRRFTAEDLDETTVRLEIVPHHGTWEYQLGQWEGIVLAYHPDPVVTYEPIDGNGVRFDVKHR